MECVSYFYELGWQSTFITKANEDVFFLRGKN